MENSFKIIFDFNFETAAKALQMEGEVALKHSSPHYEVTRINRLGHINMPDILPDINLKCVLENGQYKWVHTDSGKETYLSKVVGAAIEQSQGKPEVAEEKEYSEEDF